MEDFELGLNDLVQLLEMYLRKGHNLARFLNGEVGSKDLGYGKIQGIKDMEEYLNRANRCYKKIKEIPLPNFDE